MAHVAAYKDIANPRIETKYPATGCSIFRSDFIERPAKDSKADTPMAYLHEGTSGHLLRTHFHVADQFQVTYGLTQGVVRRIRCHPGAR